MADDQLKGRTIVNLPGSGDGLRGPARTIAVTAQARTLADAIVARLDRIDLFELDGALVLLAGGELRNVNGEILREIIRTNFVTKHMPHGMSWRKSNWLRRSARRIAPGVGVIGRTHGMASPLRGSACLMPSPRPT